MPKDFKKLLQSSFKMKLYFILNLPLAFISGLKIVEFDSGFSKVLVKHTYFTKNPFKSIYFACLAMAAELSTGCLAMFHANNSSKKISMLVVGMQANFIKKAVGKISFICNDGSLIKSTIEKCFLNDTGETIVCKSIGFDEEGNTVAEFFITWSFKEKQTK